MIKKVLLLLITVFFFGCASDENKTTNSKNEDIRNPMEIYTIGKNFFDKGNYQQAKQQFISLTKLYPLSNEAIQSEIMIGFISYVNMDYDSAIFQFEKIINKYPSLKNLDYVYYMRALCNYEQITHHGLDGQFNDLSIEQFKQVIKRFPNSKYAKDSNQKIILVKSNKAAKHMSIGRFYLKEKKYTAALNRFKIVVENYSETKFSPEALHRMVEAYHYMGMKEESIKTASTLGYNYPNSEWYKFSYNLIEEIDENDSFLRKFKNLF